MKKKVKIKDIALYSKGTQINGDELLEEAKFDYLNGGIKPSGKWDNANCVANTVTISEGGNSCGYVNFMKNPFWCGAHCYFLYDTKIDSKYLYYALKSQQVWIMKLRSGACMPNIKKTDLGNFEFVCDDNSIEQKKITHILDKLECVIEQRKNEIQVFDELVKARFVEMFGEEKNKVKMVDICSIITDGTHESPKFVNEGIPFIFVSNISDNKIMYDADKYIDKATYDVLIKRTPIEIGDIILSTVGSYGHPAVVKSDKKFLFQRHIAYLKPKREMVNSEYLHTMIMMDYVQHQINLEVKGIAQKTLNLSAIKSLDVLMPSLTQQNEFAFFKNQVDKSKAVIEKSLKELETLQASLMQKYFS